MFLEAAEEGSGLLDRVELEVDCNVIGIVDAVAELDGLYAALGSEVVEGSKGLEPRPEVVDAMFDVE